MKYKVQSAKDNTTGQLATVSTQDHSGTVLFATLLTTGVTWGPAAARMDWRDRFDILASAMTLSLSEPGDDQFNFTFETFGS